MKTARRLTAVDRTIPQFDGSTQKRMSVRVPAYLQSEHWMLVEREREIAVVLEDDLLDEAAGFEDFFRAFMLQWPVRRLAAA